MKEVKKKLAFLESELVKELLEIATVKEISKGTVVLREEQYVKVLPVVINGLVKVYSRFEDRELLLYYIQPQESCVMSFSAFNQKEPSKIFAITEEDSKVLLLPVEKMNTWLKAYPSLNNLFYRQYSLRYAELLETIHQLLLKKMDTRLFDYLVAKKKLTNQDFLKISVHLR